MVAFFSSTARLLLCLCFACAAGGSHAGTTALDEILNLRLDEMSRYSLQQGIKDQEQKLSRAHVNIDSNNEIFDGVRATARMMWLTTERHRAVTLRLSTGLRPRTKRRRHLLTLKRCCAAGSSNSMAARGGERTYNTWLVLQISSFGSEHSRVRLSYRASKNIHHHFKDTMYYDILCNVIDLSGTTLSEKDGAPHGTIVTCT